MRFTHVSETIPDEKNTTMTQSTQINSVDITDKVNSQSWVINFQTIYQSLTKQNLASLETIYHEDIYFEDPMHKVEGIDNFIAYFDNLYTNVISCNFTIKHVMQAHNEAAVYWVMEYRHPQLNSGKLIEVNGHSHLKVNDDYLINYHRDYLDVGSMLYEHIPLLSTAIRFIKKRVQS